VYTGAASTDVFKLSHGAAESDDDADDDEEVASGSGARAESGSFRTNVVEKQWYAAVWYERSEVDGVKYCILYI